MWSRVVRCPWRTLWFARNDLSCYLPNITMQVDHKKLELMELIHSSVGIPLRDNMPKILSHSPEIIALIQAYFVIHPWWLTSMYIKSCDTNSSNAGECHASVLATSLSLGPCFVQQTCLWTAFPLVSADLQFGFAKQCQKHHCMATIFVLSEGMPKQRRSQWRHHRPCLPRMRNTILHHAIWPFIQEIMHMGRGKSSSFS